MAQDHQLTQADKESTVKHVLPDGTEVVLGCVPHPECVRHRFSSSRSAQQGQTDDVLSNHQPPVPQVEIAPGLNKLHTLIRLRLPVRFSALFL